MHIGAARDGDPDNFVNIWVGAATSSALAWVNTYIWHDKTMLFEQFHWKKAHVLLFQVSDWNQMSKEVRDSYYFNWPIYFP